MQITKLVPPINGLFSGDAISTRGRRSRCSPAGSNGSALSGHHGGASQHYLVA